MQLIISLFSQESYKRKWKWWKWRKRRTYSCT